MPTGPDDNELLSVAFSADGERLATIGPNSVAVWGWSATELISRRRPLRWRTYTLNQSWVATIDESGDSVSVHHLYSDHERKIDSDGPPFANVFSKGDGTLLAIRDITGNVDVWQSSLEEISHLCRAQEAEGGPFGQITFRYDNELMAAYTPSGGIHIWDVQNHDGGVCKLVHVFSIPAREWRSIQ